MPNEINPSAPSTNNITPPATNSSPINPSPIQTSPVMTPPAVQPVNPVLITVPMKVKKSHKKLFISLGILGFVIIFLLFSFLVKIGGQAIASRVFDATGNHRAALAVDSIFYSGDLKAIGSIGLNRKNADCGNNWDNLANQKINLDYLSTNTITTIGPASPDQQDLFLIQTLFSGSLDAVNGKASAQLGLNVKTNTDKYSTLVDNIRTLVKSYYGIDFKDPGTVSLNTVVNGIINSDKAYLKLGTLKTTSDKNNDFNQDGSMPDYYSQDLNLTNEQKQALQNLLLNVRNLINVKLNTVLSKETGRKLVSIACQIIDKVDVGAPQNVAFGPDGNKVSKYVRPISISLKTTDQITKLLQDNQFDIQKTLYKDDTLKQFLKGNYKNLMKIQDNIVALSGREAGLSSPTNETQEEFNKNIDEAFDSGYKNTDAPARRQTKNQIYIDGSTMIGYISMDEGKFYGSKSEQVIKFDNLYISQLPVTDPKAIKLFTNGILIRSESYDQRSGKFVDPIVEPSLTKSFQQDFVSDFYQTQLGKNLKGVTQKLIDQQQEATSFSYRQRDLTSIQQALENEYSKNGKYPLNLNSTSLGGVLIVGTTKVTLRDPSTNSVQSITPVVSTTNKTLSCGTYSSSVLTIGYLHHVDKYGIEEYFLCTPKSDGTILDYSNVY